MGLLAAISVSCAEHKYGRNLLAVLHHELFMAKAVINEVKIAQLQDLLYAG
jgi:hypothetical protein